MIRALDRVTAFRLGRTLSAQAYGQFVTIAVQIALVPLLLHAWGTQVYGSWLLLSAVPFYLTFSDFGFTFVAKNAMVMAVAAGRRDEAIRVFQTVLAMLCVAAPLLLAVSIALVLGTDLLALLSLEGVSLPQARAALLLLIANVLLYQFFLLVCAGIRSENRPASEATWAASSRLGEGAAVALAALAGGGILAAAGVAVVARLLFLAGAWRWLRRRSAWLRLGFARADRATLRQLWSPALAYMVLPFAQALLIQGPVLVVGGALGAAATVAFATSRTLARLGTAAANMITNSVTSEYAALAGAGDRAGAARLFRVQAGVTLILTALYALTMLLVAPVLLPWLTHGTVRIAQPFFALLVAGVAAEMLWSALFAPIAAVNRHRRMTLAFGGIALASFAGAYPLAERFGLAGVALAVLAAHGAMAVLCWRKRQRVR